MYSCHAHRLYVTGPKWYLHRRSVFRAFGWGAFNPLQCCVGELLCTFGVVRAPSTNVMFVNLCLRNTRAGLQHYWWSDHRGRVCSCRVTSLIVLTMLTAPFWCLIRLIHQGSNILCNINAIGLLSAACTQHSPEAIHTGALPNNGHTFLCMNIQCNKLNSGKSPPMR